MRNFNKSFILFTCSNIYLIELSLCLLEVGESGGVLKICNMIKFYSTRMGWKDHKVTPYLIMTFLMKIDGRSVWTARGTILKNKPYSFTFYESILVSRWTFQPTIIYKVFCWLCLIYKSHRSLQTFYNNISNCYNCTMCREIFRSQLLKIFQQLLFYQPEF